MTGIVRSKSKKIPTPKAHAPKAPDPQTIELEGYLRTILRTPGACTTVLLELLINIVAEAEDVDLGTTLVGAFALAANARAEVEANGPETRTLSRYLLALEKLERSTSPCQTVALNLFEATGVRGEGITSEIDVTAQIRAVQIVSGLCRPGYEKYVGLAIAIAAMRAFREESP